MACGYFGSDDFEIVVSQIRRKVQSSRSPEPVPREGVVDRGLHDFGEGKAGGWGCRRGSAVEAGAQRENVQTDEKASGLAVACELQVERLVDQLKQQGEVLSSSGGVSC